MGDHRISLKVEFEMHGHKAKIDQWVNYTPNYAEQIAEWLREQIEKGMDNYLEAEFEAGIVKRAETEARERAELERLKAKYEPKE
jgi:hypothetical protein